MLSRARLAACAAPALPLAMLALPFYVLVPSFYASSLGLPIALVGEVLLCVRLIDAIADPVIGYVSDRIRPGFGRRRSAFLVGALLSAGATWFAFVPAAGAGAAYLFAAALALSLGWTIATIAYGAWGAELATDYHGRTRLAAARESASVVGTVVALAMQAIVPALGLRGEAAVLAGIALTVAALLPAFAMIAVAAVPEPVDFSQKRLPFREGLAGLVANAPFRRLIVAFLFNGLANGLPATLFLFFVKDRLEAPGWVGPLLLVYFLSALAFVPVWTVLARRISKHRAWALAMIAACIAFAPAPFLGSGDVWAFLAVTVLTGATLGADVVLTASLQADAIDAGTAESGEQRTGFYLAAWALATKLALALAVGIAFPLLSRAGYDPGAGIVTPDGLRALAWLYAGLPIVLKAVAIALMWRFPVDQAAQGALRARIEAR